ncbi:UNVERIFIED_CONTAM: hypothetical protein FKN15_042102 [Acipenser sinensis]
MMDLHLQAVQSQLLRHQHLRLSVVSGTTFIFHSFSDTALLTYQHVSLSVIWYHIHLPQLLRHQHLRLSVVSGTTFIFHSFSDINTEPSTADEASWREVRP